MVYWFQLPNPVFLEANGRTMTTTTQPMTAEQLGALPDHGKRYELVEGELRMMSPAGNVHGRIAARLTALLFNHVDANKLGQVYAAETGFLLARDPDTVRAPDVAFVRNERLTSADCDVVGYLPLAPDLVAEVVSPSDLYSDVEDKALSWLDAGAAMVLVVDPRTRTLRVCRAKQNMLVLHEDGTLDADDVVAGWELAVGDLFK